MQTQKSLSGHQSTPLRSALAAVAVCGAAAALPLGHLDARQMPAAPVYAIQNAKIVTPDATIEKGNLVMRDGIIEAIGATAAVPADAVVVDGSNMTVYPGLIDMTNTDAVEPRRAPAEAPAASAEGRGGRGRGGNAGPVPTWADAERTKREALLNPDYDAADHVKFEGADMEKLAAAGVTSVLAVPASGLFHGTSALVNVVAPADHDVVSDVAGYRRGEVVIASPVAEHVTFDAGRGGGPGYPQALLGDIAFVRQAFYDARWQKAARAWSARHADQPRPDFDPALDALVPALDRRMPVSFEAGEFREILRALAMAKEFNLEPIITGGLEADVAAADLKAANAKVILTLAPPEQGGGRGGRGNAQPSMRESHMRQNMPKVPAALEKAGVLFAFSSEGLQNPSDFVRDVARAVHDGGLTAQQALAALTVNAAKIAGAADRVGSLAKGQIANAILVEGDLFSDQAHIRRVFVDGRPVDLTPGAGRSPK